MCVIPQIKVSNFKMLDLVNATVKAARTQGEGDVIAHPKQLAETH